MGKLARYRLLKKVQKMLDAPVKSEESYESSSSSMYVGDRSSRSEKHESNPNYSLRRTQVNEIASMLLQQICRMENMLQGGHDAASDDSNSVVIDNAFTDIAIAFAELDAAMVFTEAEKATRREEQAKLKSKLNFRPSPTCNAEETLALLCLQIEEWQLENMRKQRKISRVDMTIQDLGLNINDMRCAQILSDRKEAVAASEAAITSGARLCRQTWKELEGMFAIVNEK